MQILTWALPSGFLSSVVTWLVTRRQRNNDFLASLQKSIDLLTEKYTETLNENVRLQALSLILMLCKKPKSVWIPLMIPAPVCQLDFPMG